MSPVRVRSRRLMHVRFVPGALVCLFVIVLTALAYAQQPSPPIVDPGASVVNEQTLLRHLQRIDGAIDQPDPRARVLIQPAGRTWDHFHEVILPWIGGIALLGTIAGLAAAYFVIGKLRIAEGRSGRKVPRFKVFERIIHWLTAVSFIILGLTGLNITFGKDLLLPLIGYNAFSTVSQAAKYVHDFTSFPFVIGLVLIAAIFVRDNIPDRVDIEWFRQGGGFIKSRHAPARRFNAGEKLVYWGAIAAGLLIAASGFLLLFPFYFTDIAGMQVAQMVHGIVAVLFIALILGHIYIGTVGMEGAFEAMWSGTVDYNWAKEHHDLWLKELANAQRERKSLPSPTPAE
jgi:formate dehydrogenase subunit gamma